MNNNINVAVGGPINTDYPKVYKTKFLKPGIPFSLQVTEPNTKYVIKHNFDLGGGSVTIPRNCILEFDGGSVTNGTVTINEDTIVVDVLHSAGGSDNRPTIAHAGFMYFDTDLCIPVWFNGSEWIKADGTVADMANNEQI